ncbi:MAG: amino acid permease [Clostridia bacterium]|nr:amino acid permease [Clostridia bacterium]
MHRKRNKSLGLKELVAIALGGMVGGGIFTILGVSVSMIKNLTPVAIFLGGMIALLAAYSYVKLGVYYKDEGATYAFIKRTYPGSHFAPAMIGWFVVFGYISTLALYAYTFASYSISGTAFAHDIWVRKIVSIGIISVFTAVNVWSVNGMGKIEDLMVYTKLLILFVISIVLIKVGAPNMQDFLTSFGGEIKTISFISVLIVSSITFVAYEGFQLVINATNEMKNIEKNIPHAIYTAIFLAVLIYLVISFGALLAIPAQDIIQNKEFALAAGAGKALGSIGSSLVILGAVLATSSAISGTLFGSSRQMAAISEDRYLPTFLSKRKMNIPISAIITMAVISSLLILVGGLELILEFGSVTFLLVSLLMAIANFKMRKKTNSSPLITLLAIGALSLGGILILYYEFTHALHQMRFIIAMYIVLTIGAYVFSRRKNMSQPEAK